MSSQNIKRSRMTTSMSNNSLIGRYVDTNAHPMDVKKMINSKREGKEKGIGISVKRTRCIDMVYATAVPMRRPTMEEEKTITNASYTAIRAIQSRGTPIALRIPEKREFTFHSLSLVTNLDFTFFSHSLP